MGAVAGLKGCNTRCNAGALAIRVAMLEPTAPNLQRARGIAHVIQGLECRLAGHRILGVGRRLQAKHEALSPKP